MWYKVPDIPLEVTKGGLVRYQHNRRELRHHKNTTKRIYVMPSFGGKKKPYLVHRLLALTFIKREHPSQIYVDHKNRDHLDNRLTNLRWVTPKQNSHNTGRHTDRELPKGVYKYPKKYVVRVSGKHIGCYNTIPEARYAYLYVVTKTRPDYCPKECHAELKELDKTLSPSTKKRICSRRCLMRYLQATV